MKKALQFIFRELVARGLSHANVYIANRRIMKFLTADKYLVVAILHLRYALLGFAPA